MGVNSSGSHRPRPTGRTERPRAPRSADGQKRCGRVCECGWYLDPNCSENREPCCPIRGEDRWIGALEPSSGLP
ncbi:hypothetical protein GWG54_03740 [Natronococcus sp. JC468]|uniref:hypothetical protein n=1 Tax=Natronococcus sp. JC468 TaxID=1961921 RepID=UPI001439BCAE|nr:hypothetical protein [Natronococcus sp. JC468]NKE34941.1 hypothetical protein [Natronococcus sp. JC468]